MWFKRLLKRIKWLLINQWLLLTLSSWPYETCENCEKAFRISWLVEDKYWYKVMDVSDDGGGSLCLDCFLEKANKKGVVIPEDAVDIFLENIINFQNKKERKDENKKRKNFNQT